MASKIQGGIQTPLSVVQQSNSINGIGLFCHEFSHTLGLPDIYPTNEITEHNQSPEYWDVMDTGNYQACLLYTSTMVIAGKAGEAILVM